MKSFLWMIASIAFVCALGSIQDASQDRQYSDISLPPVASFRDYCARCHGYEGAAYGKDFANIGEDSLEDVIEDMMFGPAGLNPDSISIAAMVAYNRALSRKVPFAVVLNARSFLDKRDSALSIEASPGALVEGADSVRTGGANSIRWIKPRNGREEKSIRITVQRKGVSSVFQFPDELWSR
jgi:cytochrome c553